MINRQNNMFGSIRNEIKEIYDSRNILKSLVVKNLIGRYRNSVLGFCWHFVMPMLLLFVYYIAFDQIRATPIPDFWVYLASGLFPFNFMINNLTGGSACVVNNAGMVKKMYFPREIIVLSQVISTFIVMLIGYSVILIAIIITGYGVGISLIMLPVLFVLTFMFTLGCVLVFSALTVYVRDVQYFLSSISILFFFLTPMYFLSGSITGLFGIIVSINPFTYFIESFHDIVFYQTFPDLLHISMTLIISVLSITIGYFVFRKLKIGFAERL